MQLAAAGKKKTGRLPNPIQSFLMEPINIYKS